MYNCGTTLYLIDIINQRQLIIIFNKFLSKIYAQYKITPEGRINTIRNIIIYANMALTNISGIPDKHWQPPFVAFETTMGEIVVELYWKHVPITCRNFAELTRRGYYNGTKFHRIIRDFMIQGGDPTGTGKGGVSIYGECFDDEIHDDLKHTGAGVVSMANSGPNTNGSQFFITLAPTQWLDGKHTIFGRIHSGMTIVKRIGLVETDKNDRPVDDIKIVKGSIRNA